MKKICCIVFLLLLFLSSGIFSETSVEYDKTAVQGEILPVYLISDEEIENTEANISLNNKSAGIFKGFYFGRIGTVKYCSIILVSFPSDISQSVYNLTINWSSEGKENIERGNITVSPGSFRKESISLSYNLSTLRKDDSERRKKETRAIIEIYRAFNLEHIYNEKRFSYPLRNNPVVTSFFGDRRTFNYDDGESALSIHNGIDFAAPEGTPVFSCGDGLVVFSGNRLVTGNSIIIEHLPGLFSVYYHMKTLTAEAGSIVEKGDKIGEVGSTGISTGPHLHWEIRNQGIAVDPEQYTASLLIDKSRILSKNNSSFSDIDRGR